jgi:hypothetical protein
MITYFTSQGEFANPFYCGFCITSISNLGKKDDFIFLQAGIFVNYYFTRSILHTCSLAFYRNMILLL